MNVTGPLVSVLVWRSARGSVAQPRSGRRCSLFLSGRRSHPFHVRVHLWQRRRFIRRKLATPACTSQGDHERGRGCVSALGLCAVRLAQLALPRVFHRSPLMGAAVVPIAFTSRSPSVHTCCMRPLGFLCSLRPVGAARSLGHPVCQSRGVCFRRRPQDEDSALSASSNVLLTPAHAC